MKKKFTVALALALIPLMQVSAFADKDISIIVNGDKVQLDQPPVIEDGRTLVPFRAVLEKMGASVDWDDATRTVTCTLADNEVSLVINSDKMQTSAGEVTLDVPAKIINSRTMVPIRAISEGLGASVEWNESDRSVTVTSNVTEPTEDNSDVEPTSTDDESVGYVFTIDDDSISTGDVSVPISAVYPKFNGDTPEITAINNSIQADVQTQLATIKEGYTDFLTDVDNTDEMSININYEIRTFDDDIVSMSITDSVYLGGVHPSTTITGVTYDLNTGEKLSADSFIENALTVGKDGIRSMVEADPDEYPFYDEEQFTLTDDDYYIEDNKLVFLVQEYEIAPYARGIVEYKIDLKGIK